MLIHSDVWGPALETRAHDFSYYVLFIDDCTQIRWINFLRQKSEVFQTFVVFFTIFGTQFQAKPQILRTDNEGEYKFFNDKGLIHQTTYPDIPQQNGVAEWKNRTLLEITRAIMLESNVPTSFLLEYIATANYL